MTTEFFQKAKNNLNAAQLYFDNGFYDACANRAYYAALQAAVAALEDKGLKKETELITDGFRLNSAAS